MTRWSSGRVASVLGTAPAEDREFTSVGTDTRTIEPGALDHFDLNPQHLNVDRTYFTRRRGCGPARHHGHEDHEH